MKLLNFCPSCTNCRSAKLSLSFSIYLPLFIYRCIYLSVYLSAPILNTLDWSITTELLNEESRRHSLRRGSLENILQDRNGKFIFLGACISVGYGALCAEGLVQQSSFCREEFIAAAPFTSSPFCLSFSFKMVSVRPQCIFLTHPTFPLHPTWIKMYQALWVADCGQHTLHSLTPSRPPLTHTYTPSILYLCLPLSFSIHLSLFISLRLSAPPSLFFYHLQAKIGPAAFLWAFCPCSGRRLAHRGSCYNFHFLAVFFFFFFLHGTEKGILSCSPV